MANKRYVKGANFEREFCKLMKKERSCVAIRTAGSHSPFDVILIPVGENPYTNVIVAQLKTYKRNKPRASEEYRKLELGDNVTKWWVTKKDYCKYEIEVV